MSVTWTQKHIEMDKKKQFRLVAILVTALIVIDQVVKIIVKTTMQHGEEIFVLGDWFRICFIENKGIAFGMLTGEWMAGTGKVILTLLRIVASGALAWFLVRCVRRGTRTPVLIYLSLILAGAIGNVIDSCFYGLIFSDSYYHVATLFPEGGGYGKFLQGKVVDMFYFPLFEFDWPQWIPFVGGHHFKFFNAIFNVADACVTVGVFWMAIDQLLKSEKKASQIEKTA